MDIPCFRNFLANASEAPFSAGVVLLRLSLLDRGVSPGVSFRECLLLLLDFDDFDERAGVTLMASGAGVDGPGCGAAAESGSMCSTAGLTIGDGTSGSGALAAILLVADDFGKLLLSLN